MTSISKDTVLKHLTAEGRSSSGRKSGDDLPLNPSLLIPLARHSKATAGLDFVSHFFTRKESVRLTLMHIPPSQAAAWADGDEYGTGEALETQAAAADKRGQIVVEQAARQLKAAGFSADNIEQRVAPAQMSKAKDIIQEARKGKYDAVVLGRRVQEGLADILDQSVCRELLEGLSHAVSFPLWLCRLPERERGNVLLCVDGSAPSERMADHVGFMLAREPGHDVTVFHVHDPSKSDAGEAEAVVERAVEVLVEAEMPTDRISRLIKHGSNPAGLIHEEYDAGNYAAVAIGSAGSDRGLWNKLFIGSVARTIFKDLSGAALWVCF